MQKELQEKLAAAKLKEAEATVATAKIRHDAAYKNMVRAQARGAGPDVRARLVGAYDRAADRLEQAQEKEREARRASMGLEPRVEMREAELEMLSPVIAQRLRALGHGGR